MMVVRQVYRFEWPACCLVVGGLLAEAGRVLPPAPLWLTIFLAAPWARAFMVTCPAGPGGGA